MRVEEVRSLGGRFVWSGGLYPAGEFSMRNIDQNKYQLLNKETGKNITEMDEEQAFHEIHEGAVYMHDGEFYQVVHMNLETKIVEAVPFHGNYYTVPGCETNIRIIHRQKKQEWKRTELSFVDVNIADFVYMYKKMQFHNHQNLGFEQLRKPLTKNYDTEAAWIKLPENVVTMYRNLFQPDNQGYYVRNNHFEGLIFSGKICLPESQEEQKISKEFKLAELDKKWEIFCSRITEKNETFAGFFHMVSSIEIKGDSLIFYVKEAFYAEWADMPENRNAIVNILRSYVSVPDSFQLVILSGKKTADNDKTEKMMRRYHSLKKDEHDGIK